ncbi:MAG: sugar-binding transcriptional regulator [Spirochaetia bacterium]|jgi:DNA-binding transcriptional regulator LsrR (DeoR family)
MARVPDETRRDFLVEVAKLYYEQDLSQAEIARKFAISRSLVSHLLKRSREQGIVEIRINDSRSRGVHLQRRLCERFGLADAVVVPSNPDVEKTKAQVGRIAAALLEPLLKDNIRIGISWGTTLHQLVSHVRPLSLKGVEIVQLHGGLGSGNPAIDGFGLAQQLAEKLSGSYRIIQAPIVVQSDELRDMLMREPRIVETLRSGAEAGIALFGIGSNLPAISSLVRTGALTEEESLALVKEGAVGTVCGLHIDAEGRVFSGSLNRRLVGISFETLARIPVRLGLAAGTDKAVAVRGALRGGFVTALVVDEQIAEAIVGGD